MAAIEVPQTLEYRGGQPNAAPTLEVENFTNWKKRKLENQWTGDERKAANLYQRLKSLIMYVLLDDQINSVINFLTTKSTWDDLILYHKGPSDVKESRVMDLKLCYNTSKFKEDNPDDEEDTRSIHEYLNDLEEEYQARALLAKSKRYFKKASKASIVKNKGLITEAYEWDEEEVSSDDNEMVEVKVLMALVEENDVVSKEGARNGEWVKISMRKCDIRKSICYLDSGCSRHMTGVKIFTKVAFVNGLKYNLISISQLCDAKYIVQFDEKRGTIFNSNKEVVMIAPRVRIYQKSHENHQKQASTDTRSEE
ncbi:hypothetical protein Tco_0808178 [Tanacetum coccineum]